MRVIDSEHDYTNGKLPEIQLIRPREIGLEYYVDHHNVRSNHDIVFLFIKIGFFCRIDFIF